jgi:hypothetical protein
MSLSSFSPHKPEALRVLVTAALVGTPFEKQENMTREYSTAADSNSAPFGLLVAYDTGFPSSPGTKNPRFSPDSMIHLFPFS